MPRQVHVVGGGLAGLSAAVELADAGQEVVLHEATSHAGGRCRSYHDRSLGMTIDNGNHLILSGNRSALAYLEKIGATDRVCGPPAAKFDFIDLATDERWTLDLGTGRLPLWILDSKRRVPGTRPRDYLAIAHLLLRPGDRAIGDLVSCSGTFYKRLLEPVLVATLNNDPATASAKLAAAVMRETMAAGGSACRPLIARDGLAAAFVDPALDHLRGRGVEPRFGQPLRRLEVAGDRVTALGFAEGTVPIGEDDAVVLAIPPEIAVKLVPGLAAPTEFRGIANLHYRVDRPTPLPPMVGVVNGLSQWIFRFPGRLSVTISDADAVMSTPREEFARRVWAEVAAIAGLSADMPAWQVVRERRATFATLCDQERLRPGPRTRWQNMFLAGDWTDTGLPPTIEGAVRSGMRAAHFAMQ